MSMLWGKPWAVEAEDYPSREFLKNNTTPLKALSITIAYLIYLHPAYSPTFSITVTLFLLALLFKPPRQSKFDGFLFKNYRIL